MTLPSMLVTDTNIWIDLENGKILSNTFRLPYQFFITDFAVDEFVDPDWIMLQNLGLQKHGLEPEYITELFLLKQIHSRLSVTDLASLLLAKLLGAGLITGDRRLNELATAQGLPVHGILWILDEMLFHHIITTNQATNALKEMLAKGARLPKIECQRRFVIWQ